jgi:hypothetical protein
LTRRTCSTIEREINERNRKEKAIVHLKAIHPFIRQAQHGSKNFTRQELLELLAEGATLCEARTATSWLAEHSGAGRAENNRLSLENVSIPK